MRAGAYHNGDSRPYVLSFHTFFRRVKKVCRLPAGTGEVEVKAFDLSLQLTTLNTQHSALSPQSSVLSPQSSALSTQYSALSTQLSALSSQLSTLNFNTAGWRPRPALYSFCLPKKSKQKKGTPLLARLRRVPSAQYPPGGRK